MMNHDEPTNFGYPIFRQRQVISNWVVSLHSPLVSYLASCGVTCMSGGEKVGSKAIGIQAVKLRIFLVFTVCRISSVVGI